MTASETVETIAIAPGSLDSATVKAAYTIVGSSSALSAPASGITATGATFHALVNTLGLTGAYNFVYGTAGTARTSSTARTTLGAAATSVAATAQLSGLRIETTYDYQVVVTPAGGSSRGNILSFTKE